MEEEHKHRSSAINARKKLEGDFKGMQEQVENANKAKEDAIKQLRRLQVNIYVKKAGCVYSFITPNSHHKCYFLLIESNTNTVFLYGYFTTFT